MAAAAPAAAAAAPAAGKGAATAAGVGAGAGAAGAAGAGGGGLMAFLGSPTGQLVASSLIGVIAGQNPQSAAGARTGLGAFSLFQDLSDRGNVSDSLAAYSAAVDKDVGKEVRDRAINESVVSMGADRPTQLAGSGPAGGAFVMGGPAPTTYGGTSMQELEAYRARAATLPATGRANPSQAGFMLADVARGAPTPGPAERKPTVLQTKAQLEMAFPGHELSARMTDKGYSIDASAPDPEGPAPTEPAQFTTEELAGAREVLGTMPAGVTETISVLGPGGAKRTLTGKGETPGGGGGGVSGATGFGTVNPLAGQLPYNRETGESMPITEEQWAQIRRLIAMQDSGGVAGTVIRNPDGTLSIRR